MIKGFVVKKNIFTEKEISSFERNLIFFISEFCKKKSRLISKKAKKILNFDNKKFRLASIKLLEEIEKKNKKIFYEISKECSNIYSINSIDQNKKVKNFIKSFFGKTLPLAQRRDPVMLFNKKNLSRLKYEWHQESQFYPEHDLGLHFWFPVFRNVSGNNDGGMVFAKNGYKKNYKFKEVKKKDSWVQRIPKINIEKKFELVSPKINRKDAIFFIGPQLHKSDNQTNLLPRVSFVIRYLSKSQNKTYQKLS